MIVAIHQPNYIPWLGYFFKIAHVDRFVFLDMVQYPDRSFVNRNSIKTPNGTALLTIPVLRTGRSGQLINQVETDNVKRWAQRHMKTMESNYGRAPYFAEVSALLEPHYLLRGERSNLSEFNMGLIRAIAEYLEIPTSIICASELSPSGARNDRNLDICRILGATAYLAGLGAKNYQEDEEFTRAGIEPLYSLFQQQNYPQLFGGFIPKLSIVDVLMNCGSKGTRRLLELVDAPQSDQYAGRDEYLSKVQ